MRTRDVGIATPCTLDWKTMTPRDAGRFCAECKTVVRDLSLLTEREARALLATPRTETLCVRLLHDRDGQVIFADTPRAPLPAAFLHRAKRAAIAAGIGLATQGCSAADFGANAHDDDEYDMLMGGAPMMPSPEPVGDPATDAGKADSSASRDAGARGDGDAEGGGDGGASTDGGATSDAAGPDASAI